MKVIIYMFAEPVGGLNVNFLRLSSNVVHEGIATIVIVQGSFSGSVIPGSAYDNEAPSSTF